MKSQGNVKTSLSRIIHKVIGDIGSLIDGLFVFMYLLVISSGYLDRTRGLYRHLNIFGSDSHKKYSYSSMMNGGGDPQYIEKIKYVYSIIIARPS